MWRHEAIFPFTIFTPNDYSLSLSQMLANEGRQNIEKMKGKKGILKYSIYHISSSSKSLSGVVAFHNCS